VNSVKPEKTFAASTIRECAGRRKDDRGKSPAFGAFRGGKKKRFVGKGGREVNAGRKKGNTTPSEEGNLPLHPGVLAKKGPDSPTYFCTWGEKRGKNQLKKGSWEAPFFSGIAV